MHSTLMEVLLRFRTYNVTLITDTLKMYILIQLALWTNIFTEVDIADAEELQDNTIYIRGFSFLFHSVKNNDNVTMCESGEYAGRLLLKLATQERALHLYRGYSRRSS